MIKTKNISRKFSQTGREIGAVRSADLNIEKGSLISITGHSGSGKSTLLNLIAGLLKPTEGEVLINGIDITKLSEEDLAVMRNSKIGYVMQGNAALSNLTVWENVCIPFHLYLREGDVEGRAKELLDRFGILALKDSYPSQLSGGELKRMSIARALINRPEILLADEPTVDLDSENTKEIMTLFRQIADEGTTVIVVTHELDTLSYADATYVMNGGVLEKKVS